MKTKLLEYTIHLRNKALVDQINTQLKSAAGGTLVGKRIRIAPGVANGVLDLFRVHRAPFNPGPPEGGACVEYAINAGAYPPALPMVEVGGAIPTGGAGYVTSPWFTTSNTFRRDVATFTISTGWWIFGSSTKYFWGAKFEYAPPNETSGTVGVEPSDPAPIPARMGISSGEMFDWSMGSSGLTDVVQAASSLQFTREAARRIDGFGWAHILGSAGAAAFAVNFNGTTHVKVWDRLYVQAPAAPNTTTQIWRIRHAAVTGVGFAVAITGGLNVAIFDCAPAQSLIGTFGPVLIAEKWNKFDFVSYLDAPNNIIYLDLYLNGTKIASVSRSAGGIEGNRFFSTTHIGKEAGADLNSTARFRFHSWVIAFPPVTQDRSIGQWSSVTAYVTGDFVHTGGTDPATWKTYKALQNSTNQPPGGASNTFWRLQTVPVDWRRGSLVQHIRPKAFAATHNSAWGGDWRILGKCAVDATSIGTELATTTAQARCAVETDIVEAVNKAGAIGWVALQVSAVSHKGGAGLNGTLGYKIGAAAPVMTSITQTATFSGAAALFNPTQPQTTPQPLNTLAELHHEKGNDAANGRIAMLQGVVEVIGIFGDEDLDPTETPTPVVPDPVFDRHNVHLPMSPWALQPNAQGPVQIVSGTYVGNSLGQDLAFQVPPAFVYIRPLTGDTGGSLWFCSMLDGHQNYDQGTYLFGIVGLKQDTSFAPGAPTDDQQMRFLLQLASGNPQINQTGVTYAYFAFCDPAKRFCLGGLVHVQTNALPHTHALRVSTWTPEWAFIFKELYSATTTNGLFNKSLAHAADAVKDTMGSTLVATGLTFGTGSLQLHSGLVNADFDQFAYMLFRRADGNNDPNQHKVMFIGSYTGDGTASRTVSLAPPTGLRPMWAIVVPDGASAIHRDPSNLTNTSNIATGGTTTTGITGGGIDSFSVGSSLNANGVVYHFIGFWGSSTAGNGGWSPPGTTNPVPTETPPLPDILDEPTEEPDPTTTISLVGEPDLDTTTIISNTGMMVSGTLGGQVCEFYTRELVNNALALVGISKVVTNLATELTEVAVQARRFVRKDINSALRDGNWDFATLYQTLVLVTGSIAAPANNDWTYAYRGPTAMMKARRLAKIDKGRKFDPEPIAFREGMDATGPLIFCNVEATTLVPLVLEYTARVSCPAFFGDALFREAVTWKFAASFAGTVARDKDKQAFCLQMYERTLPIAKTVDAQEQQQEDDGDAEWISGRN